MKSQMPSEHFQVKSSHRLRPALFQGDGDSHDWGEDVTGRGVEDPHLPPLLLNVSAFSFNHHMVLTPAIPPCSPRLPGLSTWREQNSPNHGRWAPRTGSVSFCLLPLALC